MSNGLTKIMHVEPGYYGESKYTIDVNFDNPESCIISPLIESTGLNVQLITYEGAKQRIYFK
mgnify:FL=1